jgi:hypothetical protein
MQNTIDFEFTTDQLKQLDDAIAVMETLTRDFNVLTAEEKGEVVKAPDNSDGWMQDMTTRVEQNLSKLRRDFTSEPLLRDIKLATDIAPRQLRIQRILDRLESARFKARSDGFANCLDARRQLRAAKVAGVDDDLSEGLRRFFSRADRSDTAPTSPPAS